MLPSNPKNIWKQATNLEMLQATQFAYGCMICNKSNMDNAIANYDSDSIATSKLSYTDSLCSKNDDDIISDSESSNYKGDDMQFDERMYKKGSMSGDGNVLLSKRRLTRLIKKTLSVFNVFANIQTSLKQYYRMHLSLLKHIQKVLQVLLMSDVGARSTISILSHCVLEKQNHLLTMEEHWNKQNKCNKAKKLIASWITPSILTCI